MNPPLKFAVIGNPIAHSRSPAIHRLFAEQTGIRMTYDLLPSPLDGFAETVEKFFAEGGCGLNVTVPFKEQACALSTPSVRAQRAAASNTLWREGDQLHSCNTDGVGLLADLARLRVNLENARILLIGAGGAARGVVHPLLEAQCARLHVVNRTPERAQALCSHFIDHSSQQGASIATARRLTAGGLDDAAGEWELVINATSSGLQGDAPRLPGLRYAANALAYDMLYAIEATPFMRSARQTGAPRCTDGLGMLVGQAAASFAIWHGITPDIDPVLHALREQTEV